MVWAGLVRLPPIVLSKRAEDQNQFFVIYFAVEGGVSPGGLNTIRERVEQSPVTSAFIARSGCERLVCRISPESRAGRVAIDTVKTACYGRYEGTQHESSCFDRSKDYA